MLVLWLAATLTGCTGELDEESFIDRYAKESLGGEDAKWSGDEIKSVFSALESGIVRGRVIHGENRIDGRDHEHIEIRARWQTKSLL